MASKSIADEVKTLLWNGNPQAARTLIQKACSDLEHQMRELKSLLPDQQQLDIAPATAPRSAIPKNASKRELVLAAAADQARTKGYPIHVEAIAKQLADQGYDFGIPPNRVSTTISSLLRLSGRYRKVNTGRFVARE